MTLPAVVVHNSSRIRKAGLPFVALFVTQLQALFENFLALLEDALDELFWPGRAAGDVDIDWHNRIYALHGVVAIVKFAARVGGLSHAENPFRLWHLLPEQVQPRAGP